MAQMFLLPQVTTIKPGSRADDSDDDGDDVTEPVTVADAFLDLFRFVAKCVSLLYVQCAGVLVGGLKTSPTNDTLQAFCHGREGISSRKKIDGQNCMLNCLHSIHTDCLRKGVFVKFTAKVCVDLTVHCIRNYGCCIDKRRLLC